MKQTKYRGLTKNVFLDKLRTDGKGARRWAYGFHCKVKDKHYIILDDAKLGMIECTTDFGITGFVKVDPETVGQYTGLLDWWENDLLCKGSVHPCAPIGIITYNEQKAMWTIVSKSGGEFCGLAQAYINGWAKIGNDVENPELLEEGKSGE